MPGNKAIILHIGTHKTGTTALQRTLYSRDRLLHRLNVRFYSGCMVEANHVELHLATMRADRFSIYKHRQKICVTDSLRSDIKEFVRTFIRLCPEDRIIFSAELLLYLRYRDELNDLLSIFEPHDVRVIVYFREKEAFLKSYRLDLRHDEISTDPTSFGYVEPDSWLVDYDALISAYRDTFGAGNVLIRDYDADSRLFGGTVRSFGTVLGFSESVLNALGEKRLNASSPERTENALPPKNGRSW